MIRVALFGYGHLGKIHLKCLRETDFELIGVADPRLSEGSVVEGVPVINNPDELLGKCDAVIIASSTHSHFALADRVLEKDKHIFLEKPMTKTADEARMLLSKARLRPQLITQVGFVERHNPAYIYLQDKIDKPRFIEVHRLAGFNERGNDVSVVFDLMIHDLDILLQVMKVDIRDIHAHGIRIISDSLDICNARIEFVDGSVANLTASRMSLKQMRKFRIFQESGYLSMDLDRKESQIVVVSDEPTEEAMYIESAGRRKYLKFTSSGILDGNAILSELTEFYNSIVNGQSGAADFENAYKTTVVADQIEKIAIASSQL